MWIYHKTLNNYLSINEKRMIKVQFINNSDDRTYIAIFKFEDEENLNDKLQEEIDKLCQFLQSQEPVVDEIIEENDEGVI